MRCTALAQGPVKQGSYLYCIPSSEKRLVSEPWLYPPINMPGFLLPGLLTAGLVAALVSAFSGKDDDNHEPQSSTNSSSRSSDTTRQPNQSPPSSYSRDSYVRDQKAGKRHLTSDNGRSLDDSKHTSPHARASSRTQTSPSVPSRFQTTAATVARDQGYHDSNLNLSPAVQPPQPASTPAYAYHQPSPVLADLSEAESEIEYIEDDDIGKELRDRARRHGREMRDARAQAKSARKGGDHLAERYYKQVAVARKSAMDELNTKAAKIIFHHKNKVCI